jgi:hypothetical protein
MVLYLTPDTLRRCGGILVVDDNPSIGFNVVSGSLKLAKTTPDRVKGGQMSEAPPSMPPDLWAGSQEGDSVAAVNPADLRNVWKLFRDDQACNLAVLCVVL